MIEYAYLDNWTNRCSIRYHNNVHLLIFQIYRKDIILLLLWEIIEIKFIDLRPIYIFHFLVLYIVGQGNRNN